MEQRYRLLPLARLVYIEEGGRFRWFLRRSPGKAIAGGAANSDSSSPGTSHRLSAAIGNQEDNLAKQFL